MNANSILLPRNRVLVPAGTGNLDFSVLATFNLNLQALGYTLSPGAMSMILKLDVDQCVDLHNSVLETLKELKGVHNYRPMYPNFPNQVFEASAAELYVNATIHYFTAFVADVTGADCIWLPVYKKDKRVPLDEKIRLTVLHLATADDLEKIATALATSNTSLSLADKESLSWLIKHNFFDLPAIMPNKENAAIVGSIITPNIRLMAKHAIAPHFKTATDVLRLAVAMSSGDVSLSEACKFRNFPRKHRRFLLGLLEACGSSRTEDMNRWRMRWIRLGEKLHPGEFQDKFPAAFESFNQIRSGDNIDTFNSKLERFVRAGKVGESIDLLSTRPGVFARRLDQLIRTAKKSQSAAIVTAFGEIAGQISTPVLLQVGSHFRQRRVGSGLRVIFPKGNTAKVRVLENELLPISKTTCLAIMDACTSALIDRFALLPKLGSVYVDPVLDGLLVPFSQRSASPGTRTLVRGSKIPFSKDKDTVRFFIWWKDMPDGERVDIDLAAVMYNDDWEMMEEISYTNLRNIRYRAAHSGDITSAPNGACEFIDIDIPSLVAYGGRYVIMNIRSFTHQPYDTVPECAAGWMLRDQPMSGEVFDPRTVVDKINLTTHATSAIPLIIDLVKREIIWADSVQKENSYRVNNVNGNLDTITLMGRAFTQIAKPTIYELLALHAEARGTMISTPEEADVVFTADNIGFDVERIASEFMPDLKQIKAMELASV